MIRALILLGLSIVSWLRSACLLEMQGMAVHRVLWGASIAYFFANVNVMGAVLNSVRMEAVEGVDDGAVQKKVK